MNERQIDSFLKEKARTEQIRVSDQVEEQISCTMQHLPRHRKALKPGLAIAAVLLASVVALTAISPTYAENLPILKSVFKYLGRSGDYTHSQYSKYATQVNQSVTDKGYTVTVNEIAADDNFVVISFTVNSSKGFSKDLSANPYLFGSLTESGRIIANGTGRAEMVDENTFAGYTSYFVGRDKLPEELSLNYKVEQVDDTKGDWSFNFKTAKQGTGKDSKVISPNIAASLPFTEFKVSKVILSPFANTLMLNATHSKWPNHYGFFVLDDKGKALYVNGENERGRNLEKNIPGQQPSTEQEVFFVKGKEEPKELTLIPYTFDPNYDTKPPVFLSASARNLPVVFTPGNNTKVTVTKIESNASGAEVHYTVEGLYPYGYAVKMVLLDEKGNTVFPKDGGEQLIDPETNEFVARFNRLDSNKEYKVATPQLNDLEVLMDNKITVPLR